MDLLYDNSLIFGIFGGLLASQIFTVAQNLYNILYKSQKEREQLLISKADKNIKQLESLQIQILETLNEEQKKDDEEINKITELINTKLSEMSSRVSSVNYTERGNYRTQTGMYNRSYEYLKKSLNKENNAKTKELQKFLEGVACRDLELEPETPPKTETNFRKIHWNNPNGCTCSEVLKSFELSSEEDYQRPHVEYKAQTK